MMDQQMAPRLGADLFLLLLHAPSVYDFRERDDMPGQSPARMAAAGGVLDAGAREPRSSPTVNSGQ
jgi:hypothetical protein